MSTEPTVAKTVWTDADFDAMNWHDNAIHALAGDCFSIGLRAPGFIQYLRRAPIHSPGFFLSVQEREGYSFDERGY